MNMMRSAASALFLFLATIPVLPGQTLLTGPNKLSFTATSGGGNPAAQTFAVRHTGDTAKTFTLAISTLSGGPWLSVSAGGGTTPSKISVSANAQGLAPGTYSGTIQVAAPNSPTARVDVSLTVVANSVFQVSPTSLGFLRQVGTDSGLDQYILVNTTGSPTTYSISTTTSNGGSWLVANATPTTTPGLIAVRVNTTGLAAGSYTGSIAVASPGVTTINVPVNLTVSVNPVLSMDPPEVILTASRTGTAATQKVNVLTSSGVAAYSAGASTTSGGPWLVVSPTISSAPGNLDVSANPSGLPVGTYKGSIVIGAAAAANSTLTVPVTFTVTDSPVIGASPLSLSTSVATNLTGTANVLKELPAINLASNATSAAVNVFAETANGGAWLTAGSATGTAPGPVNVFVDATGLTPGTYIGNVTVQGPGNSITVPVFLTVTAGDAQITADPATITFNYQRGQTPPSNQVINVTSSGAAFPLQSAITSITPANSTWLGGAVVTGLTPLSTTLNVNAPIASTLANGQYTATVTFAGQPGVLPAPPNTPSVNVVLNVSDTALFNVNPAVLDFTVPLNGAIPASRTIAVTATDGTPKPFTVTTSTSSGGSWLLVGPTSGNTPTNISVQVLPFSLGVGVYEGTVAITVPSISPTPQNVRVRMTIQSTISLSATPTSLSFAQGAGSTAPASRTIAIAASAGTANFQVSTTTANGGNWLTVTPTGGSTPNTLTVNVNGASLPPGTYTGSVGITSADVNNSPLQVPVTLVVSAASMTATPATVALTAVPGSTAPVTQNVAIAGGVFSFTVGSSTTNGGSWLSATPASGTAPGSVTISASPLGLAAGTYNGIVTVTATGVANSPLQIPVTLTVAAVAPSGRQIISQIADGAGWKTTITLVNLDTDPAPYTLRFFASDGAVLRLPFEGGTPGRLEILEGTIPVGGSRTIITGGTDTTLSQGWAELTSAKQIGGLGVFRQRVAGRPDQEAGVSAVTPSSKFLLPYDNTQGFVSSMAIANTNLDLSRATTVTPRLEDGTALVGDSVNLPARGHTAFEMAGRFPSMSGRKGAAEFSSTGPDFAALGLRFSPGGSFTSLPALEVPLTTPTAEVTKVISQIADGTGWKTIVTLVNLDTVPAPFTLRFFKQDGSAMQLPISGGSAVDVIEGTIAVGGTRVIESLGTGATLSQGWAQLTTTRNIGGQAIFRQSGQEAAVTLTSGLTKFVLPFDNTTGFTTSMALANTTATLGTTITVVIRDEAGQQIATDTVTLNGRGHTAFELPTRFVSTRGRRGTLEFGSSSLITGLGLRFNETGAFTSFPVLPKR